MKIMIPDATEAELNDVANAMVQPALPWWNGQMQRGNSEVALDQHDALQALVALARDDLHVMRLRQIWDVIRMRLIQRPMEDDVVLHPRGARLARARSAPGAGPGGRGSRSRRTRVDLVEHGGARALRYGAAGRPKATTSGAKIISSCPTSVGSRGEDR